MKRLNVKWGGVITALVVLSIHLLSCEKENSLPKDAQPDDGLTVEQLVVKQNLAEASKTFARIVTIPEVHKELAQLSYLKNEINTLPFKDLMGSEVQTKSGKVLSFSHLKDAVSQAMSVMKSSGQESNLLQFLVDNNCYLYVPFSLDWYPEDRQQFTVAGHPICNSEESVGYLFSTSPLNEMGYQEVLVSQDYADDYPVILVLPHFNEMDSPNTDDTGVGSKSISTSTPMHEVKIYEFWCRNYCGGIFEGDPEIYILRGYATSKTAGTWSNQFHFKYPRDLVKAAQEGKDNAWQVINTVWDANWSESKEQDILSIYDYDWNASKKEFKGAVKWKEFSLTYEFQIDGKWERASPILVRTELLRTHFFSSQATPGPLDEVRNGRIVRQWGDVKITTNIRRY